MVVLDPKGPVKADVPTKGLLQALRDGTDYLGPGTQEVIYNPKVIDFFGTLLRVHVMEGTPAERWEATLATYLLSDIAKGLIV